MNHNLILIPLQLETNDLGALWDAARHAFLTTGAGDPSEVEAVLGARDKPILARCIRELYWDDSHHHFTSLQAMPIEMSHSQYRELEP